MKIDAGKEAEVWRRVRGEQQPVRQNLMDNLLELILEERISAAAYLQLSRQMTVKESAATLQRLFREEQAHAACLKGIYTLIKGMQPTAKAIPPEKERMDIALRKCYGREMRSLMEYEKRSTDPEYGPVFARLAEQEREHCRAVLELIGNLSGR